MEDLFVLLVGEFGIGDGDFAPDAFEQALLARAIRALQPRFELLLDRTIDTAHEEARDTSDVADIFARLCARLESGDIGFRHLLVDFLGKQQSDVDIDPLADQLLDRRQAFGCAGHFDHQVGARYRLPEPAGFFDRGSGIGSEKGRHFEAHVAVTAVGFVIDGTQHVRCVLDIANGELLKHRHRRHGFLLP